MKDYKLEVWATLICFILVAFTGGFLSVYFVIANERYFDVLEPPPKEELAAKMGDEVAERLHEKGNFFVAKEELYIMGFPRHYFLLIVLSWLGATAIGAVWCVIMDRIETRQKVELLSEERR